MFRVNILVFREQAHLLILRLVLRELLYGFGLLNAVRGSSHASPHILGYHRRALSELALKHLGLSHALRQAFNFLNFKL